jgi:hypothetical protein
MYPTDEALSNDTAVTTWITAIGPKMGVYGGGPYERLVNILVCVFFEQVRHNYQSSSAFGHIGRYMHVLSPQTTNVSKDFLVALVHAATSIRWVPLVGRGFDQLLVNHTDVHRALQDFYGGLGATGELARAMHHPYSLPSAIEASSGV